MTDERQVPVDPRSVIEILRSRLEETFVDASRGATRCALIDFPHHRNVGDNAIWEAQRRLLRRFGISVEYVCDSRTYSRRSLAKLVGDGLILLSGGGNFGDVWPHHQMLKEQVIRDTPDNPIVLMPQTAHFYDPESLRRAQDVIQAHGGITLMLRDPQNVAYGRRHFPSARVLLSPDTVFALGHIPREQAPDIDMLWVARSDVETLHPNPRTHGVPLVDWDRDRTLWGPTRRHGQLRIADTLWHRTEQWQHRQILRGTLAMRKRAFDVTARYRLKRGIDLLSRAQLIITDRLHCHVLCVLLGIPNVLMDNAFGKNRALYEMWTRNAANAAFADTPDEAFALAQRIAAGSSS